MSAYIFVLAALTSVIPLSVIIYISVKKLITDPKQAPIVQKNFLFAVLLSKLIPVGLLIFGIAKLTYVDELSELYTPWLIILVSLILGLIFTTQLKKLPESDEEKAAVNTLISMARPLFLSIPLISIIFIYLMLS